MVRQYNELVAPGHLGSSIAGVTLVGAQVNLYNVMVLAFHGTPVNIFANTAC